MLVLARYWMTMLGTEGVVLVLYLASLSTPSPPDVNFVIVSGRRLRSAGAGFQICTGNISQDDFHWRASLSGCETALASRAFSAPSKQAERDRVALWNFPRMGVAVEQCRSRRTHGPPDLEVHTLVPSAAGASGSFRRKSVLGPCSPLLRKYGYIYG